MHGLWLLSGSWQPWRDLFEAATANVNPFSGETAVESKNPGVTEIAEIPGRGHSLIIDSGWKDVAQVALDFVKRAVRLIQRRHAGPTTRRYNGHARGSGEIGIHAGFRFLCFRA